MTTPLNIKITMTRDYDNNIPGYFGYRLLFKVADASFTDIAGAKASPWFRLDTPEDAENNVFESIVNAVEYWKASKSALTLAEANAFAGTTLYHVGEITYYDDLIVPMVAKVNAAELWIDEVTDFAEAMLAAEDSDDLAAAMALDTSHIGGLTSALADIVSDVDNLETAVAAIPDTFDDLTDGTTNKAFTATEKTKLSGIASDATVYTNTDADARITAQKGAASGLATLDGGSKIPTNQLPGLAITSVFTVASQVAQLALTAQEGDVSVRTDLNKTYCNNGGTAGTMADWTELLSPTGGVTSFNSRTGAVSPATNDYTYDQVTETSTNKHYTSTEKTKLSGIASSATANDTDANLKARANHTGTQTASTISDFGAASRAAAQMYSETTQKLGAFPIVKSATVSSGVAVFHLTADGTSGGTALFSNGPVLKSPQLIVNDAAASYQFGWVWSNSNKTLTVTTNKLSTANILTGVLGQTAANGSEVDLTVWGN